MRASRSRLLLLVVALAVELAARGSFAGQVSLIWQTKGHNNCWAAAAAMVRLEKDPATKPELCPIARDAIADVTHRVMCRCDPTGVSSAYDGPCLGSTEWGVGADYTPSASTLNASNYPTGGYFTTPLATLRSAANAPLIVWQHRGRGSCGAGQAGHLVVVDDSDGTKLRVVDPLTGIGEEPEDDFRCGSRKGGSKGFLGHCVAYVSSPAPQLEALDPSDCEEAKRTFSSLNEAYSRFVADTVRGQKEFGAAGACEGSRAVARHEAVSWDAPQLPIVTLGPDAAFSDLCVNGAQAPFLVTYDRSGAGYRIRRIGQRELLALFARFWSLPRASCPSRGLLVVEYPDVDDLAIADLGCFLVDQPSAVLADELRLGGSPELRRLEALETTLAISRKLGPAGPVRERGAYQ